MQSFDGSKESRLERIFVNATKERHTEWISGKSRWREGSKKIKKMKCMFF